MKAWRGCLAVLLSALLPAAASLPAAAAAMERAVPSVAAHIPAAGVSASLPALSEMGGAALGLSPLTPPLSPLPSLPAAAQTVAAPAPAAASSPAPACATAPDSAGTLKAAPALASLARVSAAEASDAPVDGRVFDGSGARQAPAVAGKAAAVALAAPAALLSARHLLGPAFASVNYTVANGLALIFPLPEIHRAFSRGHADGFPLWRAVLGAIGASAVGLMNATVLDKPLWGTMYLFVSMGLLAPYFIGGYLSRKGAGPAARPAAPSSGSRAARIAAFVARDQAFHRTLAVAAALLATSVGLYYGAAAVIPHALSAAFSQAAVDRILFGVQVLKGLLFAVVFVPDAFDMLRGKKPKGFSPWLDFLFVLSTSAFVAWGVQAALSSPPGMIRRQYYVHAGRNLVEALAAASSFFSVRHAERRQ